MKATLIYLDHSRASPLQQGRASANGIGGIQTLDLYSAVAVVQLHGAHGPMVLSEIGSRFMAEENPKGVPRRMQSGDLVVLGENVFLADFNKWTQIATNGWLADTFREKALHVAGPSTPAS